MHVPFLEPDRLQRPRRDLTQQRDVVRTTEGPEARCGLGREVRVTGIQGRSHAAAHRRRGLRALEQNQASIEVSLEQDVYVYPFRQVAAVANIDWTSLEVVVAVERDIFSILDSDPSIPRRQEVAVISDIC